MRSAIIVGLCGIVAFAVTACGGGGGGSDLTGGTSGTQTQNVSPGGIWEGTNTENGVSTQTLALVSEDGRFYAVDINLSNDCAAVVMGAVSTSGNTLSGVANAALASYSTSSGSYVQTGCVYPDNSTWGTATLSGTVAQRSSVSLTSTFTTANGEALPAETATLSFNSLYDEPSSLSKIAGNWLGPTGLVISVNSDGTFYEQDPTSGCVINGRYSIIDASYNLYAASATYANCQGSNAALNGLNPSGLVTIDDTVTPNKLAGGASVTLNNGAVIVVAATATRD